MAQEGKRHVTKEKIGAGILASAWWFFYFPLAIALYSQGFIEFNAWANIALAAAMVPALPRFPYARLVNGIRHTVGCACSLWLLAHESTLPSLATFWSLIVSPSHRFSSSFVMSFLYQSVDPAPLLLAAVCFFLCLLAATIKSWRSCYPASCVAALLFAVVLRPGTPIGMLPPRPTDETTHAVTDTTSVADSPTIPVPVPSSFSFSGTPPAIFDAMRESEREQPPVVFSSPGKPAFDILLLQVCSFGWDDFDAAAFDASPFFSQFDYIFTRFNTADSYSHTAAIRLLRGTCGLTGHDELFEDANPACYVLDDWRNLGYQTASAFNHNGAYADFEKLLQEKTHIDSPYDLSDLAANRVGFDGSPVYNDHDVLSSWLAKNTSSTYPLALFYNSIYLHAGNHDALDKNWWQRSNSENYRAGIGSFTKNLERFFDDLKNSGRSAVVVLIGEHGANLRKTPLQIQTVREIPTPSISIVPAAVKFFGPDFNDRAEGFKLIDPRPVSYQGLYTLLANILSSSSTSFDAHRLATDARTLPTSPFFATGDKSVVVEASSSKFAYRKNDGTWAWLPPSTAAPRTRLSPGFTIIESDGGVATIGH